MKKLFSLTVMLAMWAAAMAQAPAVYGDVDGDGFVTSYDVTVLYNYLLNDDMTFVSTSDVNGDGDVTSADITEVYNILLGIATDTHQWVDLGLPSGTLWATTNVDVDTPEGIGGYYAWGEIESKDHQGWDNYKWCNGKYNTLTKYCTTTTYGYNGFTDGKTELDPEDDVASVKWGSEWRTPSREQMAELRTECTWQWTTSNGVKGYLGTSKHNNATIFLPASGYHFSSEIYSIGTIAYYWTRTLHASRSYYAYYFFFHQSGSQDLTYGNRNTGYNIRPVRASQE